MKNIHNKRLLKILGILHAHSDEEHPLTTNQIIEKLSAEKLTCTRQSLYKCIALFNDCGYEIIKVKSTQNKYYLADRPFSVPELKILIDSILTANFITEDKTNDLIGKIASLAGAHKAKQLTHNTLCTDTAKLTNKTIYYSVDAIDRAILSNKKISFCYFDYDINGNEVFRKNKERYIVNPLSLVFSDSKYYLVCYNDDHPDLSNYRIDRMRSVEELTADITPAEYANDFNVHKHLSQSFSMYSGEPEEVTLLADNSLIDAITDKFGLGIPKQSAGTARFIINVTVRISPTFFAWCATFGNKIMILSPNDVTRQYIEFLDAAASQYKK